MKTMLIATVLTGLVLGGCGSPSNPQKAPASNSTETPSAQGTVREFKLNGEVVSVNNDKKSAMINHKAIEGFMEAMTMSYPVPDPMDLEKLKAGEHITATVYQSLSEGRLWIAKVQVEK